LSAAALDRPRTLSRFAGPLFAALAVALLAGCAQSVDNIPPAPRESTPQPGVIAHLPPYKVQVGDVLDIKLFQNPELNDEVTVRPDGMISTALAQDVPAYNHTPTEITSELVAQYKSQLANPMISVVVHSFAPNRVYVAGEVEKPGEFITAGPNLTVSQAVARAGGVKLSAQRDSIFIIRRGPNDTPIAYHVDYYGIITGADPGADVRLAQYDIVYVPRTGIYEIWTYFNQYVQQFMPASWGFNYTVNPIVTGHP